MITAGIDIGSISAKAAVLIDGRLAGVAVRPTGYRPAEAAARVFDQALDQAGVDKGQVVRIVATGYGRAAVDFANEAVTEISCHAAGAHFQAPDTRSVIDIGGQDSKAIVIDDQGRVMDFAMNDKCAAGTGRFLEVMARALELELEDFGRLDAEADAPAAISSLCTVFAESEVISLIAEGQRRANIVAGIHRSIGQRVAAMGRRIGIQAPVLMTGGVAYNQGVIGALEESLAVAVRPADHPQVNGAIGAALLAARKAGA